ncbi:hypothetical protein [Poritiphilus flavus]|uniref:Uncharacterized protein n=1 Tax=Poritiphilus flavus TaxID=2697053 RepID=A0A6L9EAH3_9FLAO|nr:hypothetical protein [Poritiphilus flavus]NAS11700.1 hypothetical protein [Poritiphilus flavus]
MGSDKIEKILEKYFEATATEAEERTLKNYFLEGDIAPHLEQYAPMFTYFSEAKEERFTRQVPLNTRSRYYKWISVAAVALVAFGIYFGTEYQQKRALERQEAEIAYQETKKALDLLATNFGKGTQKMAYLNEFETTKQKIYNKN